MFFETQVPAPAGSFLWHLLDKSLAVAIAAGAGYSMFRWHTKAMTRVFELLREAVIKRQDEHAKKLEEILALLRK